MLQNSVLPFVIGKVEYGTYQLYHMHISNEWNELKEDELFPFEISTRRLIFM